MRSTARHINGLPYNAINALLPLCLTHGTVYLSEKTIRHIEERHPDDFILCMASIDTIIATPDFIDQEPHHRENFEVIKNMNGVIVLVAISAVPDEYGDYPIQSSYIIPHNALHRRLRKGHILRCK